MKPSVVVDIWALFGGAEECRGVSAKVLGMGIKSMEAVVPNKEAPDERRVSEVFGMGIESMEAPDAFGFQNWSIPKIDLESEDGGPEIPEKSNKFEELYDVGMLLLSQAYKSKGDVDFKNCVNGESGLGGCVS
jgi:hypothetical protein